MIVGAQFFQTLIMFDITTARVGVIFIPQLSVEGVSHTHLDYAKVEFYLR